MTAAANYISKAPLLNLTRKLSEESMSIQAFEEALKKTGKVIPVSLQSKVLVLAYLLMKIISQTQACK